MQFFIRTIIYLLCTGLVCIGCTSPSHKPEHHSRSNIEDHIGLYRITKSKCRLTKGLFNPCENIKFLELVKGRFYGVSPDQLALVQWHAKPGSSEIEYTASLISDSRHVFQQGEKIWLVNHKDKNLSEEIFFLVKKNRITDYFFRSQSKNLSGKTVGRDFHYTLARISREKIKKYKLDYPKD